MRLCFVATETYPDDDKIGRHLILSLDVWILYCSPTSNIETSNTTITRTHTHHILYITQESILFVRRHVVFPNSSWREQSRQQKD